LEESALELLGEMKERPVDPGIVGEVAVEGDYRSTKMRKRILEAFSESGAEVAHAGGCNHRRAAKASGHVGLERTLGITTSSAPVSNSGWE
jgi:hypothetical protein